MDFEAFPFVRLLPLLIGAFVSMITWSFWWVLFGGIITWSFFSFHTVLLRRGIEIQTKEAERRKKEKKKK